MKICSGLLPHRMVKYVIQKRMRCGLKTAHFLLRWGSNLIVLNFHFKWIIVDQTSWKNFLTKVMVNPGFFSIILKQNVNRWIGMLINFSISTVLVLTVLRSLFWVFSWQVRTCFQIQNMRSIEYIFRRLKSLPLLHFHPS